MSQRIGRYLLEERIGEGGMGVVFRGRSAEGEPVAIKLLRSRDPGSLGRFSRELEALRALGSSAGFVPLLDAGQEQGQPYLVMPFLAGGDLAHRVRMQGPLSLEDGLRLAKEVARALAAAHAAGFVHRDLKPENVLFDESGRAWVADLGLAKHFVGVSGVSLSKTAELRGTLGYMPPEQMRDAKRAGPPADVFAWGAVVYEALAGEPAFSGTSAVELLSRVASGTLTPLRELRPEVSPALEELILRALSPEPDRRFPSGEALSNSLRALGGVRAEPAPVKRSPLPLLLFLGAILLGAVGLGLWAASRAGAGPPETPAASLTPVPAESPPSASPTPSPEPRRPWAFEARPYHEVEPEAEASLKEALSAAGFELLGLWGDPRGKVGATEAVPVLAWLQGDEEFVVSGASRWCVFESRTGRLAREFALPEGEHGLQVHPSGLLLSTQGARLVARDAKRGAELWDLTLPGEIRSVTLDSEAKLLAVGWGTVASPRSNTVETGRLSLYRVEGLQRLWQAVGRFEGTCHFVEPFSALLAAPVADARALYHLEDGRELRRWRVKSFARVAPSPRGRLLGELDFRTRTVTWRDLETGREIQPTSSLPFAGGGRRGGSVCLAFTRDGKELVAGTDEGTVYAFSAESHALSRTLRARSRERVQALAPGPGLDVLSLSVAGSTQAWSGESPIWPVSVAGAHSFAQIGRSARGEQRFAAIAGLHHFRPAGSPRYVGDMNTADRLAVSPSGDCVLAQLQDATWWWDATRRGVIRTLPGAESRMDFLADERVLVARPGEDQSVLEVYDRSGGPVAIGKVPGEVRALRVREGDQVALMTTEQVGVFEVKSRSWTPSGVPPGTTGKEWVTGRFDPAAENILYTLWTRDSRGANRVARTLWRRLGADLDHDLGAVELGSSAFLADSLVWRTEGGSELVIWRPEGSRKVGFPSVAGRVNALLEGQDRERFEVYTDRGLLLELRLAR